MEKYEGKFELSLKQRYELRKMLEKELENVPEGKRKKLPKSYLEQLLFETNVSIISNEVLEQYGIDIQSFKSAKFPVWTGDFLSKLDLSEVSFDNVVWDLDVIVSFFANLGYKVDDFYKLYHRNMDDSRFDKTLKEIDEIFSRSHNLDKKYDCSVVLANTNANIYLLNGFRLIATKGDYYPELSIRDCDFQNSDLIGLEFVKKMFHSNFCGTELSALVINCGDTEFYNCNFNDTGLHFVGDLTNPRHLGMLKNSNIGGCYINGKPTTVERDDKKVDSIRQASNDLFDSYVQAIQNAELVSIEEDRRGRH